MSRKSVKTTRLHNDQSLAASFNTEWINISYLDNVGFLINCNSVTDNTGTFGVEVMCEDSNGNESEAVALTLSAVPTLADGPADFFINLNQVPATKVRLTFTAAGGTPDGTADIFVNSKSVGA
jgi:hypothetical protein